MHIKTIYTKTNLTITTMKKITTILMLLVFTSIFSQIPSYVPTNGLVGYWPFNGNANDSSGNGNNGTINGATLTSDRFGNINSAYDFDGLSNYIEVNSSNSLNVTNLYTLSTWINVLQWSFLAPIDEHAIISKIENGNWYGGYEIFTGGSTGIIAHSGNIGNSNIYLYNSNYNTNNWYNVVVTYDGNILKMFINGILVNSQNHTGLLQTSSIPLRFGRRGGAGFYNNWFKGKIDDIGIWNRALTPQEITDLYNATSANECQSLVINTGILSFNPVTYNNSVTIYPNPANDQITIDCGNLANVSGWNIKITNTLGQEVFNQPMNTQQYIVPLNSWTGQGVYFVKIYDGQGTLVNTKKIILQ